MAARNTGNPPLIEQAEVLREGQLMTLSVNIAGFLPVDHETREQLRRIMFSHEQLRTQRDAFVDALHPSGQSHRADDPNCVWVRFSQSDWDALEAIRNA